MNVERFQTECHKMLKFKCVCDEYVEEDIICSLINNDQQRSVRQQL